MGLLRKENDLNPMASIPPLASGLEPITMRDELWTHGFLATHRVSSPPGFSEVRGPLRRRRLREEVFLLGSVSVHGLCPVDVPREPAGHRGLPWVGRGQAVPHGNSWPGGALDTGRCQRITRLAHLRR